MTLNLIRDAWIPVATAEGIRIVRPDQIAEPGVERSAWPRPDLNLACIELLIGLVYLACPPQSPGDWRARRQPDPNGLRDAMAPLAGAFELAGDGPRFLQDLESLEGDPAPPDMLFIDSAGGNTARNNADLMVRRGRYPALDPAMAAMALYTLQAFAPEGGRGILTSMRGGGPLVTLLDPPPGPSPLWSLIWANVPEGEAVAPADLKVHLPWLRETRVSTSDRKTLPPEMKYIPPETFFGMPRRLRLVVENGVVTGVVQRPYGTSYALWRHPLTPYYRVKEASEPLPAHPKAGSFGYRNWIGVLLKDSDGLREPAECTRWRRGTEALRVAGWSMASAKPRDFLWSRQPLFDLDIDAEDRLRMLIQGAEMFARALAAAVQAAMGADGIDKTGVEAVREAYYARTQAPLERIVRTLLSDGEPGAAWLAVLRQTALDLFDDRALPGLADRTGKDLEAVLTARRNLVAAFAGRTKTGQKAYAAFGLKVPEKRKEPA